MDWQKKMNRAVDYIEENLTDEIKIETASKYAECSIWEFQRLFSFIAHISLGQYIQRRKLTLAGNDIQKNKEKITDIAIKYGYDSLAAFSRAFSRLYGISPSSARKESVLLKQYPKITFEINNDNGGNNMSEKNESQNYYERGYYIKNNAPIYLTKDLKKTLEWFVNVLGWYGNVDQMPGFGEEYGDEEHGYVIDHPVGELTTSEGIIFIPNENAPNNFEQSGESSSPFTPIGATEYGTIFKWNYKTAPPTGFELLLGEPMKGLIAYMKVYGLENLRKFVIDNGWNQITEIEEPPYMGIQQCSITTIDGYIIRFFEEIDCWE